MLNIILGIAFWVNKCERESKLFVLFDICLIVYRCSLLSIALVTFSTSNFLMSANSLLP